MKRLGPELKMPDLKVPPVLSDVYWDLRERHLLPLVGLVLVAIVAAPFLLGAGSEDEEEASAAAVAGTSGVALETSGSAKLAVVQAEPGLRDYRKRLSGRSATDPFKQRYTAQEGGKAELNAPPSSGESTTPAPESGTVPASETGAPSSEAPSGGGSSEEGHPSGNPDEITLFAFAIEAKVTRSGGKGSDSKKKESWTMHQVLPQEALPGEKAPVVTYMGISRKEKPLLLVSTDVDSVFGETRCVAGDDACQLIEVEPGFPVVFVYGGNAVHYTMNVLDIKPVMTGKVSAKGK